MRFSQARTTQPSPTGFFRLLSSRWRNRFATSSSLADGSSLMIRTRPYRAPTDSTYFFSVGAFSTFTVHTPSLSGLPNSQKPRASSSPLAEARTAKFVSPPDFQSR